MNKFCNKCGTPASANGDFCASCGNNMVGAVPPPPYGSQQPTPGYQPPQQGYSPVHHQYGMAPAKKSNALLISVIAGCTVLLIATFLIVFFVFIRDGGGGGNVGGMADSREADAPPATPAPTPAPVRYAVGDIIQFGNYDWHVLDVQGNQALIITDRVIDHRLYHHTFEAVAWEASEIRQWLNGDFFASFSPANQARIAETYVINNDNPWDFSEWDGWVNTPGGNNTVDRIFLLSIDEVLRYFGDSGLVARGATMGANERADSEPHWPEWGIYGRGIMDQYSEARIAPDLGGSASWWWLRSPGFTPYSAALVSIFGDLDLDGLT